VQTNYQRASEEARQKTAELRAAEQQAQAVNQRASSAQQALERATQEQRQAQANADQAQVELAARRQELTEASSNLAAASSSFERTRRAGQIERQGLNALRQFASPEPGQLQALLSAMRAGQELQTFADEDSPGEDAPTSPLLALQTILEKFQERNQFQSSSLSFSPDGQYVLTDLGEGTSKVWNLDGTEHTQVQGYSPASARMGSTC
jgi:chromosome segregation ATPase